MSVRKVDIYLTFFYLCPRLFKKSMKSLLVLSLVFACMALSVDYLWVGYGIDEVKVFQYVINKSDMIKFTDDMYCYDISYPDFLYPAEDNADGANRFNYNGRTDLMVETTVIDFVRISSYCAKS